MKQKDWAMIIAVAAVSAIVSFVLAGKIIKAPTGSQQAEVVEAISPEFNQPDPKYFNSSALDPTKLIQIGNNSNQTPFNTQSTQ